MFWPHWTIIRKHVDPSQSYHLTLIFTLHFGAAEACVHEGLGDSTTQNSAGYTSTGEYIHNLTPHTSMLPQHQSVT
jgi:hypothetical protein